MKRPGWTYLGWWRETAVIKLQGSTLRTKLDPSEFGGGRIGGYLSYGEIQQFMCSVSGCSERAQASWAGCADQNIQRPLCAEHDVQINLMALIWWGDPEWHEKITKYVRDTEADMDRKIESWAYDQGELFVAVVARYDNMTRGAAT